VQYPTKTLGYCKLFSGEYQPCSCVYNCKSPLSDVCSRELSRFVCTFTGGKFDTLRQ